MIKVKQIGQRFVKESLFTKEVDPNHNTDVGRDKDWKQATVFPKALLPKRGLSQEVPQGQTNDQTREGSAYADDYGVEE